MGVKCEHCGYERPKGTKDIGLRCPICGVAYSASAREPARSGEVEISVVEGIQMAYNGGVMLFQGWCIFQAVMIFSDTWFGALFFCFGAYMLNALKYRKGDSL